MSSEVKAKKKRKQGPKKGRVVRLRPDLMNYLWSLRFEGETVSEALERIVLSGGSEEGEVFFVLPSELHKSRSEAKGSSVMKSVRNRGVKIEAPIEVRRILG